MNDFYNAEYLSERVAALAQERDDLRRENNYLKDLCDRQARLNLVNAKLQMDLDRVTAERDELKVKIQHGQWVLGYVEPGYFTPGGNRPWICSECGRVVSWMLDKPKENFCGNCGADMRGE